MADPISKIPIVLFPLKIETRFVEVPTQSDVKHQLWIRVFPDEAFLHSHDPLLTKEEREDADDFKNITGDDRKAKWEKMVAKYGVYRSSWLVDIERSELERQHDEAIAKGEKAADQEPSFYFKWLPDKLVFSLYRKGENKPISKYEKQGAVIDRDKLLMVLGKGDEWVQDFQKAINVGMGIKIDIGKEDTFFEKVIVSGYRFANDPLEPAKGLAELFMNHQYTEGLSFLEYGTPTNNTDKAKSGYSSRDEYDAENSYPYTIEGLDLGSTKRTEIHSLSAGNYMSYSLGFENTLFSNIKNADLKPDQLSELFQKATWFALGAQPLFMLFGNQIGSNAHVDIWKHYSKYVKARGLYPTLKIGNQPYGILPVSNISNALTEEGDEVRESNELLDKMQVSFALLMKRWLEMAKGPNNKIPRLEDGSDAYEIIHQIFSMQEHSSNYQIRPLKYEYFGKHFFNAIKHSTPMLGTPLGDDFTLVGNRLISIQKLIPKEVAIKKEDSNETIRISTNINIDTDVLFRAPVLSIDEDNTQLIKFQNGKSVLTNELGEPISDENEAENLEKAFSFAQEDLSEFQNFIDELKNQEDNRLIQYKGELSLFTDLFLRSYTNACQLYYREIIFDPSIDELRGYPFFSVKKIKKPEGKVTKGNIVLEIHGRKKVSEAPSKTISIKAPFSGSIEEMIVQEDIGDTFDREKNLRPGTALFVLVNETEYKKVKDSFIKLGQQLIDSNNAITEKDRQKAQTIAIGEAFDLNSYRLDAWVTSLAASKIDMMRKSSEHKKGIYFGAYGWVEDLEKDVEQLVKEERTESGGKIYIDKNRNEDGGIIHTPGPAQAVASAVFKNSFLNYKEEEDSNPFTLNLTSDRLQKSQLLLEGIRQGQELEALLGYQMERYLHEGGMDELIYTLREKFPLYENSNSDNGTTTGFVNLSVINGLKVIEQKDKLNKFGIKGPRLGEKKDKVRAYIAKLEDILDGSLDTLFYEAGYQITQGNFSQAAAALDATKGEIEPPILESLKTKITGTGISQKLIMVFSNPTKKQSIENTRAFVEPVLEKWLADNIGLLKNIGCIVDLVDAESEEVVNSVEVSLDQLNIGYLDFLYLSDTPLGEGASELEMRIWNVVLEMIGAQPENIKYSITNIAPNNNLSLAQALEVVRYAKTLLGKCRYLKSDDLTMDSETIHYDKTALDKIKDQRFVPILKKLKAIPTADLSQKETLQFLSNLDLNAPKMAWLGNATLDAGKLKTAIEQKILVLEKLLLDYADEADYYSAFEMLSEASKTLFGKAFLLLPPALGSDNFSQIIKRSKQEMLVGDAADNSSDQIWGQERLQNWIQSIAQVHENSEAYEDWMMVQKVWQNQTASTSDYTYQVVQGPTMLKYPWVGLSKKEIDEILNKQYASKPIYKDPVMEQKYPLPNGSYYPEGLDSVVIYAPENIAFKKSSKRVPVFGLVVEEFTEHVPDEKIDTGLSFHYNAPNNEPPQAILVAVHPKATQTATHHWREEDLRDIIFDTIDLYKVRMVDAEAIQEYGYMLPMSYWFNIPRVK